MHVRVHDFRPPRRPVLDAGGRTPRHAGAPAAAEQVGGGPEPEVNVRRAPKDPIWDRCKVPVQQQKVSAGAHVLAGAQVLACVRARHVKVRAVQVVAALLQHGHGRRYVQGRQLPGLPAPVQKLQVQRQPAAVEDAHGGANQEHLVRHVWCQYVTNQLSLPFLFSLPLPLPLPLLFSPPHDRLEEGRIKVRRPQAVLVGRAAGDGDRVHERRVDRDAAVAQQGDHARGHSGREGAQAGRAGVVHPAALRALAKVVHRFFHRARDH